MRSPNSVGWRRSWLGAVRTVLITSVSAAMALACAADGGRSTGGETHFLSVCVESESCGNGLECVCGVCTSVCSDDDSCRSLAGAECIAVNQADSCASTALTCDVQCVDDAQCNAVSAAHRCEFGRCRIPTTSEGPDVQDSGAEADASVSEPDIAEAGVPDAGSSDPDAATPDATASGPEAGPPADVDAGTCANLTTPADEVLASEVVMLGDSFFATMPPLATPLEALARAAGALAADESYRNTSRLVNNALNADGVADQYEGALAQSPVRVVIMNGGGADALVAVCDDASAACPLLVEAANAAERLLAKMAEDGVTSVVYAFYPDPAEENVRRKIDGLRPLIQAVCESSPVPCHWLDLRIAFEGRYDEFISGDGLNPTPEGSAATAREIWAVMQQQCIAQ